MNQDAQKIKERLSIVDVISSYLTLQQAGKNYKAKCPFHNEKTPSFFISPDRGTYYCFGCNASGDIFSFVEQFEGTDFLGALKILAVRAGITLNQYKKSDQLKDDKEQLYEIMEEATVFFESTFQKIPEVRAYLRQRGLSDATIKLFRIGYAPSGWKSVSSHLLSKGFKIKDIEKVGLVKEGSNGFYDRFRERIIFPINDSSSRVIAFSGRIFNIGTSKDADALPTDAPKYLNSPDTPLFNKSNVLFGIDKAKLSIRTRGYSIVVEGQIDLILSHQTNMTNTVAISGTALADNVDDDSSSESRINNLGLIRRLSNNIIFAFDGDEAGIRAAGRSAMIALSLDMQVKIAVLPEGKDPADIIHEDPNMWRDIIKNSVNIVSFHIDRICKSTSDTRIRGSKIMSTVFPFLSLVSSSIERSAYIKEINQKTGLPEGAIIGDFEKYENNITTKKIPTAEELSNKEIKDNMIKSRRENLERKLFGLILWYEQSKQDNNEIKKIIDSLKNLIGTSIFENIRISYESLSETLVFEVQIWYGDKIDTIILDMKELALNLEEEILSEQKANMQPLDTEEKIKKFNILSKRVEEIKKERSS